MDLAERLVQGLPAPTSRVAGLLVIVLLCEVSCLSNGCFVCIDSGFRADQRATIHEIGAKKLGSTTVT